MWVAMNTITAAVHFILHGHIIIVWKSCMAIGPQRWDAYGAIFSLQLKEDKKSCGIDTNKIKADVIKNQLSKPVTHLWDHKNYNTWDYIQILHNALRWCGHMTWCHSTITLMSFHTITLMSFHTIVSRNYNSTAICKFTTSISQKLNLVDGWLHWKVT